MDEPKHKAFSEYTKVVNGLTNITDMDTAITYAKLYYEAEQSIEDNITNITKIINFFALDPFAETEDENQ